MVFTWLFGQSTIIATARVALSWSSSPNQCSKDAGAHWSCSLDPIHAGMPKCTGCTLNSAHLNDFLGTRCEPWQRRLLWLSPKTWALKWQDMFWLLESLHIPLNTNPFFFIDQSTALHCLINLLEVFFVIHHFISPFDVCCSIICRFLVLPRHTDGRGRRAVVFGWLTKSVVEWISA